MTEPTPGQDSAPDAEHEPAHDPEVLQLAAQVFDLARLGDTAKLAAYIDAGVPANLTNDRGDTLLMLAAYHGHADTVRALLQRGAEVDRANDRGQTPLAGAVFKGEREVVGALVEGGADPAAGAPSAVDTARLFGKDDLLTLLGAG
ncbi:ankyrin repeat domain-containing protein [Streptomyces sp. NPDC049040]|uniref:ankyrin repeat domain-containing protein n=1 Tax=Streptomyces sp. NPDC049040 TaxID=3365593 RepID=UPI003715930E